jgi:hypothetical protein
LKYCSILTKSNKTREEKKRERVLIATIVHELVSRHVTYQVTQATAARFVTTTNRQDIIIIYLYRTRFNIINFLFKYIKDNP